MTDKKPETKERPITHLLIAGLGWVSVDRGELRTLASGADRRFQWESEGYLLTIDASAVQGSKRAKLR